MSGRWKAALAGGAGLALLVGTTGTASALEVPRTLPVFKTDGRGLEPAVAKGLLGAFELDTPLAADGTLSFLDPARFGAVPMRRSTARLPKDEAGHKTSAQAIDVAALRKLEVLPDERALARVEGAVAQAGLRLPDGKLVVSHTMAGVRDAKGELVVQAALDTTVTQRMLLAGRSLIGPGAKLRVSLDASGAPTAARVAVPALERSDALPTVPLATAEKQARGVFATCDGSVRSLRLAPSLVYYAAPAAEGRDAVLPFYAFRASGVVAGQRVSLRTELLPAVEGVAPALGAKVQAGDGSVRGIIAVRGGAAPYQVAWSSCATGARGVGSKIGYALRGKNRKAVSSDLLLVQVTDANGVSTLRRVRVAVPAPLVAASNRAVAAMNAADSRSRHLTSLAVTDVGIDYIGVSGGLPGSAVSAGGFRSTMAAKGVPTAFTWGDSLAWESDFVSQDATYVDNVDMEFYTGHANSNGWVTSSTQGDGFVSAGEPRLGDRDLEWLAIAACGPLQGIQSGDLSRWLSTFDGMHQLLGYATVTYDNTIEGPHLASYLHGDPGGIFGIGARPAYKVWQAWAQMAIDAQSPSEIWGTMGVTGPSWTADQNEYFWGRGATGPDIRASQRTGWWWIWGTA